jgi:hypothetical protein
MHASS